MRATVSLPRARSRVGDSLFELLQHKIATARRKNPASLKPDARYKVAIRLTARFQTAGEIPRLDRIFHAFRVTAADILAGPATAIRPPITAGATVVAGAGIEVAVVAALAGSEAGRMS